MSPQTAALLTVVVQSLGGIATLVALRVFLRETERQLEAVRLGVLSVGASVQTLRKELSEVDETVCKLAIKLRTSPSDGQAVH